MRKRVIWIVTLLLTGVCIMTGCDPIYPTGELRVEKMQPLSQGASMNIEIIYPNTGGSIVLGWKEQYVEIISGDDIISVSGLTITGLKSGVASIKVSATTVISDESFAAGYEEKVYSVVTEVKVEQ